MIRCKACRRCYCRACAGRGLDIELKPGFWMCINCSYVCNLYRNVQKGHLIVQERQIFYEREEKELSVKSLEMEEKFNHVKRRIDELEDLEESDIDSDFHNELHLSTRKLIEEMDKDIQEKLEAMQSSLGEGYGTVLKVMDPPKKSAKRDLDEAWIPPAKRRKQTRKSGAKKGRGATKKKNTGKSKKRRLQGLHWVCELRMTHSHASEPEEPKRKRQKQVAFLYNPSTQRLHAEESGCEKFEIAQWDMEKRRAHTARTPDSFEPRDEFLMIHEYHMDLPGKVVARQDKASLFNIFRACACSIVIF